MARVIKTVLTYQLNGSTREFNIPFEYLTRKFVAVTLLGKDRKELVMNTDYRFATRTTISTTRAWGPTDGYTQIEIRRNTSATERLVDFTDGSILRAYDLNVAQIQTMHIAEEARDLTADTIGVNNDGDLDARNRRIVNVANAVNDRDAVPFGQLKAMNNNAYDSMNKALQYRNEAEGFKNQAATSKNQTEQLKNQAAASQGAAANSQAAAKASETSAAASKAAAANSQTAARTSEVNAKTSETNANASAVRADQWANKPHGQVVADGRFSAKHYAEEARIEANKLGSWNALAGTVDNVTGTSVTFKNKVGSLGGFVSAAPDGYRLKYTNFSTILRQDASAFYLLCTNKGDVNGSFNHLRPFYIDCASGWVTMGNGAGVSGRLTVTDSIAIPNTPTVIDKKQIKLQNENNSGRWASMRVWGTDSGRSNVCEWGDGLGWYMYVQRRDWVSDGLVQFVVNGQVIANHQLLAHRGAIFGGGHAIQMESPANKAHYIISKDGTRNNWYVGRGSDNNNDVNFHSYVHGTSLALRNNYVQVNKHFYVGSAVVATDGNIQGAKWGGKWLDVYLRDSFIAKKKAWTQVWAASGGGYMAGGQQTGQLSQDLRFRNIWIKTRGSSWNFFRTGPDGIYFIAADGGWLRFQIHSNGKVFKNVADRDAPPTAIVVENE